MLIAFSQVMLKTGRYWSIMQRLNLHWLDHTFVYPTLVLSTHGTPGGRESKRPFLTPA